MSSSDAEAFREALSKAKNVAVLAGAGLSAGSGAFRVLIL
jgi:NAD-dependent SIR2 family protein deacetylase